MTKKILIILIFSLNICNSKEFQYSNTSYKTFFTIYTGYIYGDNSGDFYNMYVNKLNGENKSFKSSLNIGLSFKYQFFEYFKFGISADYIYSSLVDSYSQYVLKDIGLVERNIDDDISVYTYPIVLTIDYIPIEIPYRTYIGAGVGIALNQINWYENVSSSLQYDERASGKVIDDNFLSPAFKIYTGVELDFDKEYKYSIVGSLNLEARLFYIYRYKKYFDTAEQIFFKKNQDFNKNYTILPLYFGLSIGVSLNFYKFK